MVVQGYLSMNTNLPDADYSELEDAGFVQPWDQWSNSTWLKFLNQQAMHFITSDIPYTEKAEVSRVCLNRVSHVARCGQVAPGDAIVAVKG